MATSQEQRLEQATLALETRTGEFAEIMTTAEGVPVPVSGYPDQKSLATRVSEQIDAIASDVAQDAQRAEDAADEAEDARDVAVSTYADLQSPADPEKGAGMVPYNVNLDYPDGSAGRAITDQRPRVIRVYDYGTPGSADDSAMVLAALSDAAEGGAFKVEFGPYTYNFATPVEVAGLENIRISAEDSLWIDRTGGAESVFTISSPVNTHITLGVMRGEDTLATHIANGNTFNHFIRLTDGVASSVSVGFASGVRSIGIMVDCVSCTFKDCFLQGFLPGFTGSNGVANSNYLPTVTIESGYGNKAHSNHAQNHGSVVLWGMDSEAPIAWGNTGQDLHDNGVYGSSGTLGIAFGNSFRRIRSTGVKMRGSNNIAALNTTDMAEVGVGLSGNGVSDATGANGSGNIAALNSSSRSQSRSVGMEIQDGFYARDSIVALNACRGHAGTTDTTPPFLVSLVSGGVVLGNIADNHGAPFTISSSGTVDRDRGKSHIVAFNSSPAPAPVVRLTYNDSSVVMGNTNSGTGNAAEFRFCRKAVALGNSVAASVVGVSDSASYTNESLLIIGNTGIQATMGSASSSIITGNKDLTAPWPIATPPVRREQMTYDISGNVYISIKAGAGAFEWKQVQLL